jgi:hypothetical protein
VRVRALGGWALRQLRRSSPTTAQRNPDPTVDSDDLEAAFADLRRGLRGSADQVAQLLLAIDRLANPELGQTAGALLAQADPADWRRLDLAARRSWWNVSASASTAQDRILADNPSTLSLVLASVHPDGYIREAAVARLGELDEPLALQALTLRTTDWVGQVRDRARAGLLAQLPRSVDALIALGPLVLTLAPRERGRWLADQLAASMTSLADADLHRVLQAKDWRLRRAAYSVALRQGRLAQQDLLAAVAHDPDLIIRVRCAEATLAAAAASGELAAVQQLTTCRTAAVRAAAVEALGRAGNLAAAVAALPDRSRGVREVARAALRRSGVDVTDRYRTMLRAAPAEPGAIAGLGETGGTGDADLLRPFLADPRPRARVEAVRALRRLGVAGPDALTDLLADPSAAVTRQVATALLPMAGRPSPRGSRRGAARGDKRAGAAPRRAAAFPFRPVGSPQLTQTQRRANGSADAGGVHAAQFALEFGDLVAQPRRHLELQFAGGGEHLVVELLDQVGQFGPG